MATTTKNKATSNTVPGFSERFNQLLDRSGFPEKGRVPQGSKRFDVVPNTFKSWCFSDRIPGSHGSLVSVVQQALADIPTKHNVQGVVAWLLAGDAVPHPFQPNDEALELVELYFVISDIATRARLQFDTLPRSARNVILKKIHTHLVGNDNKKRPDFDRPLDETAQEIVIAMLQTADSLAES